MRASGGTPSDGNTGDLAPTLTQVSGLKFVKDHDLEGRVHAALTTTHGIVGRFDLNKDDKVVLEALQQRDVHTILTGRASFRWRGSISRGGSSRPSRHKRLFKLLWVLLPPFVISTRAW